MGIESQNCEHELEQQTMWISLIRIGIVNFNWRIANQKKVKSVHQ